MSSVSNHQGRRPYPSEFKREAVELYRRSGKSLQIIAGELGVAVESLGSWNKRHEIDLGEREGLSTAEREEMRELRRKFLRTEQERDLLKRAAAFFVEPGVKSVMEVDLVGEAPVGLEVRLGVAVQALDGALGLRVGRLAESPVSRRRHRFWTRLGLRPREGAQMLKCPRTLAPEGKQLQQLPGMARPGLEPGTPRFSVVCSTS